MARKSGMWCLAAQHRAQGSPTRTVPAASSQASHSTQGTMLTQPSPGSALPHWGMQGSWKAPDPLSEKPTSSSFAWARHRTGLHAAPWDS